MFTADLPLHAFLCKLCRHISGAAGILGTQSHSITMGGRIPLAAIGLITVMWSCDHIMWSYESIVRPCEHSIWSWNCSMMSCDLIQGTHDLNVYRTSLCCHVSTVWCHVITVGGLCHCTWWPFLLQSQQFVFTLCSAVWCLCTMMSV